ISGNLSIGTMVAFVAYMERVYSPLRRLINSTTALTQSIASIDRVTEFLNETYDIVDKENARELADIEGEISIENISFRYDDEESDVIKNLSLQVDKGETIALVGM